MYHVTHRSPMGVLFEVKVQASTIQEVIDILDLPVNKYPTICVKGDEPILRKHWNTIDYGHVEGETNKLTFITIPQGDFFKNILSLIATIALTLVAPYAAGIVAGALGITSTLGIQLIQAGIVLAGSFLIGTFLAPNPTAPNSGSAPSPTYSLTGQGNQARLFDVIPKQYGKHIIYPDYASGPYSEFIGNQQYLNQLFCLGLGTYQQHEARIEDTAFWNETDGMLDTFTGITMEIIPPGSPVTLFHSQVVTSVEVAGQDLKNWQILNTSMTFTSVNKRILSNSNGEEKQFRQAQIGEKITVVGGTNAGNYTINAVATDAKWIEVVEPITNATATVTVQSNQSENWAGPYVANPADTITNKLQIDYTLNGGLFYTSDNGTLQDATVSVEAQYRSIDSAGLPLGSWTLLGTSTYTRKTNTPQRFTESFDVLDGRYEVRVRRTDFEANSSRKRTAIQWGGLKAFIPNDNLYPDVTLVALRMLASGQLTQTSSKRINFIQTAKLPVYNALTETWSAPVATRSIAWAAADIIRNTNYGIGYPDADIDLDKLAQLDSIWLARGDTFNGIFDTTYAAWDALTAVLRAGRASPIPIAGKITFVRDELRAIPRGVFTPAEIQRGSFETQHILFDDESPDDIIVQFVDERTWKQNEVQCTQAESLSLKPERIQIFGITNRLQAWREGMFMGAVNAKRRVVASFTTELEGRMLMRGDMISAAHDLYEWGQTGLVSGYETATRKIFLTEPLDWGANTSMYMLLRKRDARGWGPVKINKPLDDSADAIVDATDLGVIEGLQGPIVDTFNLETDGSITSYVICEAETDYKQWIIVSGKADDDTVNITALLEDPSVHSADMGTPPPDDFPFNPNEDPNRPVIDFFAGSEDTLSNPASPTVTWAWSAASTATSYELAISYDNIVWETIYKGTALSFTGTVFPGTVYSRVRGVNTQAGAWKPYSKVYGNATTSPLPTPDITVDYDIDAGTATISWQPAIRAESYRMNIYTETTPGSGVFNNTAISKTTKLTTVQLNSREIEDAGGPWPNIQVGVTSINTHGESSEVLETVSDIIMDAVRNLSLTAPYTRTTFTAQWSPQSADFFTVDVIVDGVTKLTYTTLTNTQVITTDQMTAVGGPWRVLTLSVTASAGSLESVPAQLVVVAPTIVPVTGSAATITANNVKLDWFQTSDNGVDRTRVYYNTTNNFGTATVINTQTKAASSATTYTHTGRSPGSHYYWIVAWDSVRNVESAPVAILATVEALPLALSSFTSTYAAPRLGRAAFSINVGADAHITQVKIFRVAAGGTVNPLTDTPITTIAVAPSTGYTYTDGDATRTNILSNPGFDTDTVWAKGTGWTIASGVASHAAGATTEVSQSATITAGSTYRVGCDITAMSGSQVAIRFTGGTAFQAPSMFTTGSYLQSIVALTGNNAVGIRANAVGTASVDNAVAYLQSGTCAPQGIWDYKAYGYNSQGMYGPVSNIAGIVII